MPEEADRALRDLMVAVRRAQEHLDSVLRRAEVLERGRAEGRAYAELVGEEHRPLLVERLTDVLEELSSAGAAFRRSEARVLHDAGLSQEAIGTLFGVTRQRVSALLNGPSRAG